MVASASPKRRVAVFSGHFLPHIGGVEVYTYQLWRRLVGRGWTPLVITSNVGGGPRDEEIEGIRVRRLNTLGLMDGRFPIPLPTMSNIGTFRLLDEFKPDLVVTNIRFMPPVWFGAFYARSRHLPLLHIEHGSSHVRVGSRAGDRLSVWLDDTVGRWVIAGARRCVGVSGAAAAFAATLGARDPGVIPGGVAAPTPAASSRLRVREGLGVRNGEVLVLFLGRVTEDKGALLLLDAWARLPARGLHLLFVGEGGALAEVRRRAPRLRNVHVLGPVSPSQAPEMMSAADVFVFPSMCAEGAPLSLLEAAAAGLPVISTPQGIAGELIQSGANGLLVPPGNRAALVTALETVVADPAARTEHGRALRDIVLARYGWESICDLAEAELLRASS